MQLVPRQCLSQTPHLRSLVNLFLLPLINNQFPRVKKDRKVARKPVRNRRAPCKKYYNYSVRVEL